jgi:four helix bundle protein
MKENVIKQKSYKFALKIITFVMKLPKGVVGDRVGGQLLDSGTSVGANVEEAIGAYSKSDFTYKMTTALKEARESNYWLRLIRDSESMPTERVTSLLKDTEELISILTSIVKTSKST